MAYLSAAAMDEVRWKQMRAVTRPLGASQRSSAHVFFGMFSLVALTTAALESEVNRTASAHSRLFHCCAARESPTKYRERPPSAASNSLELQYVLQLAAPTTGGRMLWVPQPNSPCTQRSLELIDEQSRATLPHGRCG